MRAFLFADRPRRAGAEAEPQTCYRCPDQTPRPPNAAGIQRWTRDCSSPVPVGEAAAGCGTALLRPPAVDGGQRRSVGSRRRARLAGQTQAAAAERAATSSRVRGSGQAHLAECEPLGRAAAPRAGVLGGGGAGAESGRWRRRRQASSVAGEEEAAEFVQCRQRHRVWCSPTGRGWRRRRSLGRVPGAVGVSGFSLVPTAEGAQPSVTFMLDSPRRRPPSTAAASAITDDDRDAERHRQPERLAVMSCGFNHLPRPGGCRARSPALSSSADGRHPPRGLRDRRGTRPQRPPTPPRSVADQRPGHRAAAAP